MSSTALALVGAAALLTCTGAAALAALVLARSGSPRDLAEVAAAARRLEGALRAEVAPPGP